MKTNKEDVYSRFGSRVRDLRKSRNINQESLAVDCGMDRAYLSAIENGKKNPSLWSIVKLAAALGVHPKELLDFPFD